MSISSSKDISTTAVSLEAALSCLPGPGGSRSVSVFEHGTLLVKLYAPRTKDPQLPHTRDEVYVVARGKGYFWDGEKRSPFAPGTFLFAAAGRQHRFEEFDEDLAVWVMYYGQEGGEAGETSSGKR